MVLERLLPQKRAAILERWSQLILETYPADTSRFLKQEKDRFINPVGYTISQEIEVVYDELLQRMNSDKLAACLDNIIRIRAVQDFSPSQTVAFIFLLKKAIREELTSEIKENRVFEELLEFEARIDKLVLLAFDIYMKCREKVFEIRLNEAKVERERVLKLLERTNLTMESQSEG
ncbi:hypothetical protein ES703_01530 [subsurface metagenome]